MQRLNDFSAWMNINSKLSDSSIYKYTRAINTISNEMLEQKVINKSLLEMNLVELDIAIANILNNEYFLKKNSKGNNMYSNSLKQFRYFNCENMGRSEAEQCIEKEISNSLELTSTEKQMIINARVGQGKYRNGLLKKYKNRCIVTGIDNPQLLIASHIKPWSVCDNEERIDIENGLLLSPNIDRLFDYGLLTFQDNGKIELSSFVGDKNVNRLHIDKDLVVDLCATKRLLSYMEYHRDVIFVK